MEENKDISLFELQVDHVSTHYLRETAKWAKFLANFGFVWCGILLLVGLSNAATNLRSFVSAYGAGYAIGISVGYIAVAALYFFPCLYLFNFAKKMRNALQNNDQEQLNASLRHLKQSFRYLGIMAIAGLALMVVVVLFNLFG